MSENFSSSPTALGEIAQGPSSFEQFLNQHFKKLIAASTFIILILVSYFIIAGTKKHKEQVAGEALANASSISDFESVIKNHAGTPAELTAKIRLADALWLEGKEDQSINILKTAINDQPDHIGNLIAKNSLATKYLIKNQDNDALTLFESVINNKNQQLAAYATYSKGSILARKGELDKAAEILRQANAKWPKSAFSKEALKLAETLKVQAPTLIDPPAKAADDKEAPPALLTPPTH